MKKYKKEKVGMWTILCLALLAQACQSPRYIEPIVSETYVHRYGVELPSEEWEEQGSSGQVVTTLQNGVVVRKNFDKGILHGECSYTFPHRDVVEKLEMYEQGSCQKSQSFYSSGQLQEEHDRSDFTQEIVRSYYDHGALRAVETWKDKKLVQGKYYNVQQNMESGVQDGEGRRTNRDAYGQLLSIDTISDGVIALRTLYYPNGVPQAQYPYQEGIVHGMVKTFMPGGDPRTLEVWVNGIQQGPTITYADGEKVSEQTYQDGKREGLEKRFTDGGARLVEEINWVDDQPHGVAYSYVQGQKVETWYFRGKKVNKQTFDQLQETSR